MQRQREREADALAFGVLSLLRYMRAEQLAGRLGGVMVDHRDNRAVTHSETFDSMCWCGTTRVRVPRHTVMACETVSCGAPQCVSPKVVVAMPQRPDLRVCRKEGVS